MLEAQAAEKMCICGRKAELQQSRLATQYEPRDVSYARMFLTTTRMCELIEVFRGIQVIVLQCREVYRHPFCFQMDHNSGQNTSPGNSAVPRISQDIV